MTGHGIRLKGTRALEGNTGKRKREGWCPQGARRRIQAARSIESNYWPRAAKEDADQERGGSNRPRGHKRRTRQSPGERDGGVYCTDTMVGVGWVAGWLPCGEIHRRRPGADAHTLLRVHNHRSTRWEAARRKALGPFPREILSDTEQRHRTMRREGRGRRGPESPAAGGNLLPKRKGREGEGPS
jgi:hypothetical protein